MGGACNSVVKGASRHRLAVIFHADVVGSTALVRRDESIAHDRIQETFRVFSETVQRYRGDVHEIRGDALVAEFSRASDAVIATIAAQASSLSRNAELTDEIVPIVRVGIALGEVVVDDRTVTGAGVVLAQRLEQMAEPYGICASEAIREAVPDRLPVDYKDLGSQEAKGFDEPVHAYALALRSGETIPEPARYDSEEGQIEAPSRKWFAVAVVALVLIAGGLLAWLQPWKSPLEPVVANQSPLRLSGKPSIAVLAFNNMSADADQDYLAMGVSEDLITELSKVSELFVIARNSSFSYRSKSLPIETIAAELGVRFILEGSVQKAGEAVRINAQLIDASTQEHIWADRFDGDLSKAFAFQDRVVAEVRGALTNTLVGRTVTSNFGSIDASAHDAFLRGWSSYILTSPEDYAEALPHFDRAIQVDGRYGRAHAARASLLLDARAEGWHRALGMTPDDLIEQALWSLDQASNDPTALELEARSKLALEYFKFDESIAFADRAIALNPNDPGAQATKARALAFAGRPAEAVALVSEATADFKGVVA